MNQTLFYFDLDLYVMIDSMSSEGLGHVSSASDGGSYSGDRCVFFPPSTTILPLS